MSGVSVGTNTSIGIDMDIGGVLKNGFGILKFAEAPNLFRPRGGIYRGEGGLVGSVSSLRIVKNTTKTTVKKVCKIVLLILTS